MKKNHVFALLAGASAAAVAVLSVGGYLLHRKVLKYRLQELARRQAMNLALLGTNDDYGDYDDEDLYGGYEDNEDLYSGYEDDEESYADYVKLLEKFAEDSIIFHASDVDEDGAER